MSDKGKKLHSYPAKMKAVKYAEITSNRTAGRKCSVDEKRIREWQKNKNKIVSLMSMKKGQLRKQLHGVGAKTLSGNLEENIMDWIIFRRSKGLRASRKLVMKKVQMTHQEMAPDEGRAEIVEFKASRGWLEKFMRLNKLSLKRRTSVARKDHDKLIAKLVSYIIYVRRFL